MITPTHIVTNVFVARRHRGRSSRLGRLLPDTAHARAFVIGGFAPDIGLYLLTVGAAIFYPLVRNMTLRDTMELVFDDLFFNEPIWLIAQNALHGPLVLLVLGAAAVLTQRTRLLSFTVGCMAHTAVDIPVHHDDGPLVLFPIDWNTRVNSPVSYYDVDHYGSIVAPIDLSITVIGGTFLLVTWWRGRSQTEDDTHSAVKAVPRSP